jgi:hypothetical protein
MDVAAVESCDEVCVEFRGGNWLVYGGCDNGRRGAVGCALARACSCLQVGCPRYFTSSLVAIPVSAFSFSSFCQLASRSNSRCVSAGG